MSAALKTMTIDDFLAWEETQESRHEFDGVGPVAMAGGTAAHDVIANNLIIALGNRLRGKPCRVRGSNLKVEVMGRIRYPDAFVTCAPIARDATRTSDPVVIFEVLSQGTARTDRVLKSHEYRTARSLTHYVMIEQDAIVATVLERDGDRWISTPLAEADGIRLPGIGIEIPLAELYEGLDMPVPEDGA